MKKTLTVNLNGRVFHIDEDAYQLLDNYLKNLHVYFRNEEGCAEILSDFEARIEELFSERIKPENNVVTIELVEKVIAQVGRPDDFREKDEPSEEKEQPAGKKDTEAAKRKFYRNPEDKIFGGVCSGIAAYFGWETPVVRIFAAISILLTSFWIVPVYLIAWLIAPEAQTAGQKLEMLGKPITVENIGKMVAAGIEEVKKRGNSNFLGSIADFVAALFKAGLVGLGCLVAIPLAFVFIILLIVLFSVVFGIGAAFLTDIIPWNDSLFPGVEHPVLATLALCLLLGIPLAALAYNIVSFLFKLKPLHKGMKWSGLSFWIVALILLVVSGLSIGGARACSFPFARPGFFTVIQGDGIEAERQELFPEVRFIELVGNLTVNLRAEQKPEGGNLLRIHGDSNLIDKVKMETTDDGRLVLSTENGCRLKPDIPLTIYLSMTNLDGIKIKSAGTVHLPGMLETDHFRIEVVGVGKLQADSLHCNQLQVINEGVGSAILSGTSKKSAFELKGTGKIQAFELVSDSVYARVDGVGSIACNPVYHLDGTVNGVGEITYKAEPQTKNISLLGIGKIGLYK